MYGGQGQWTMEPPALNSILFVTPWKCNFCVKCLTSITFQIRDDATGQKLNIDAEYIRQKI